MRPVFEKRSSRAPGSRSPSVSARSFIPAGSSALFELDDESLALHTRRIQQADAVDLSARGTQEHADTSEPEHQARVLAAVGYPAAPGTLSVGRAPSGELDTIVDELTKLGLIEHASTFDEHLRQRAETVAEAQVGRLLSRRQLDEAALRSQQRSFGFDLVTDRARELEESQPNQPIPSAPWHQ